MRQRWMLTRAMTLPGSTSRSQIRCRLIRNLRSRRFLAGLPRLQPAQTVCTLRERRLPASARVAQEAWLTVDMLKSGTLIVGMIVRLK